MVLREGELKVYYKGALNRNLDRALEEALKKFGYERWASGMNLLESVRDLAFTRETDA